MPYPAHFRTGANRAFLKMTFQGGHKSFWILLIAHGKNNIPAIDFTTRKDHPRTPSQPVQQGFLQFHGMVIRP